MHDYLHRNVSTPFATHMCTRSHMMRLYAYTCHPGTSQPQVRAGGKRGGGRNSWGLWGGWEGSSGQARPKLQEALQISPLLVALKRGMRFESLCEHVCLCVCVPVPKSVLICGCSQVWVPLLGAEADSLWRGERVMMYCEELGTEVMPTVPLACCWPRGNWCPSLVFSSF